MQEDIRPNPLTPIWEFLLQVDQCARRIWGELVGEPIPFGTFLQKDEKYQLICEGFSERFNLLLVKALDYCHQIDLHLNNKSDFSDEEKENFQCIADACEYLKSRVKQNDKEALKRIETAFAEFKQKHGKDKPVHAPVEFQQILDAFLEVVEKQIKTPPPPQEQPNLFVVPSFLTYLSRTQSRLLTSITFSASALSQEDRAGLSELMRFLQEDSENFLRGDARDNLPNQGLGQIGTRSPVDAYKEAIMAAYAVYMGTYPDEFLMMPNNSPNR